MKVIVIVIIGALSITEVQAQKPKGTEVPSIVKKSFKKEFPGATAKEWEKEKGNFEVEFDLAKKETSATFDADGKLLETETEIALAALPEAVKIYVDKNHTGYRLSEASKITEAGSGTVSYEAEIKKGKEEYELIFDDKGNFIRKENGGQED